jgi:hypothetical protein
MSQNSFPKLRLARKVKGGASIDINSTTLDVAQRPVNRELTSVPKASKEDESEVHMLYDIPKELLDMVGVYDADHAGGCG